ncbi:alpha/beta hydrolase [Planctomonas deserti]|uniref:alpha/beta hydrolase n=1 Tax=Planctomonas deserti TaxID=2144185 RepID=UPI000D35195F|nr:alpha/beta hydrolase [Planctomonas deserti]
MIPAVIVVAGLTLVFGPAAWFIRKLARRVVGVAPRRKVVVARRVGETIELPRSTLTMAPGTYGLWFGPNFEHHALVGAVENSDEQRVVRCLVKTTAAVPTKPFKAQWTGHVMHSPSEIDPKWENITIPLRDGTAAPAWLFRGFQPDAPWVIHVQGIRTSRLVALRSVEAVERAGLTSLVITYRGAGDGPVAAVSYLGQREWSDLADAIGFARSCGAPEVYVVAWSMGAGVALELLRREPGAFERLVLIAPATNWSRIVRHGIERAGLPSLLGPIVTWAVQSQIGRRIIGMRTPLDFRRLDWSKSYNFRVPTLVLHSRGDDEIPFELTKEFAAAHPNMTLLETASAPHGWEANVDPERFQSALTSFLSASSSTP